MTLAWFEFILTEMSCCFLQSLQANVRIEPQVRPKMLPSTTIQVHYRLIMPPFNVVIHNTLGNYPCFHISAMAIPVDFIFLNSFIYIIDA
jgi:hypothetical protein